VLHGGSLKHVLVVALALALALVPPVSEPVGKNARQPGTRSECLLAEGEQRAGLVPEVMPAEQPGRRERLGRDERCHHGELSGDRQLCS
jgi:hypothetical protein